ncbi:DUF3037 domain-containing protein [Olivibacter sp. SDN3]|uniref:DUF3037 domain-containing protein n=1 Tax=Olivibacter sp. SDN3 TaxID=2764720 RepID=UPI001651324A|nr:DUF3037 domain-containing protein [Olivibacter sp. SDN3]QNL48294.1 DUF3037 domain-containing protein [Olivibacter sp. SDN3]
MQTNSVFEYAVIRVVPRVEREEFLNVGVVLYCRKLKFLKVSFELDEARLKIFSKDLDVSEIKEHLHAFQRICEGGKTAEPIGLLPLADRFRWLTATRSTIVQTSKVHPGLCVHPENTLIKLFNEQVL